MRQLSEVRDTTWHGLDLKPIPLLAPSYRLLPNPDSPIWCAPYLPGMWRTSHLDERWVVDTTDTILEHRINVDDLIVWFGEAQGSRPSEVFIWPLGRVVNVETYPKQNAMRVWSIRDSWQEAVDHRSTPSPYNNKFWRDLRKSPEVFKMKSAVLDWWGLNVWCRRCGSLGNSSARGGKKPEGSNGKWFEDLREEAFTTGIDKPGTRTQDSYQCFRCGHSWGSAPLAALDWPDSDLARTLVTLNNLNDLLSVCGCKTIADLMASMDADIDYDVDFSLYEPGGEGVMVIIGDRGAGLEFPFTLVDFRRHVEEVEDYAIVALHCEVWSEEIEMIERFPVQLDYYESGPDPQLVRDIYRSNYKYDYLRAAPDNWSFQEWIDRRLSTFLHGTGIGVWEVVVSNEFAKTGNESLGFLRSKSR